jgi:hypothetical protein
MYRAPIFDLEVAMIHIQIPAAYRTDALLLLVKSGFPIVCLSQKRYGVHDEHIKILKRKRIPFKKLDTSKIRMPKPSLAI